MMGEKEIRDYLLYLANDRKLGRATHRIHVAASKFLCTPALKRPEEAIADLDAAAAGGPADAGSYRARAALYARLGKYPQALADYTRALELQPDAATYTARGWAFLVTDSRRAMMS